MQCEHSASAQAARTAADSVPASKLLGREAKIVGYALNSIPFANVVAGNVAGVGRGVSGRVLARVHWDDQSGLRIEFPAFEVVDL